MIDTYTGSGLRDYITADDMPVLISPHMCHVYLYGHEFGPHGYIVAGSESDAYDEMLHYVGDHDGVCDHGDDPDYQALMALYGDAPHIYSEQIHAWIEQHCDCRMDDQGRYVDPGYWWLHQLQLPVGMFMLAIGDEGDLGWLTA